jgi:hypothetical protein
MTKNRITGGPHSASSNIKTFQLYLLAAYAA